MRHMRGAVSLIAAGLIALGAAACGSDDDGGATTPAGTGAKPAAGAPSGDPIVIGAPTARTGFFNVADMPATQMMQFAIDDYNKKGGVLGRPLKLVFADTKSDANEGANAALKTIDDGADVIFPSVDYDFGRAAATTGQAKGKLVVGAAGSAKFGVQGIGPLVFNVGVSTNSEGASMAEYAFTDLEFKSAYVLLDDTIEYTKSTCQNFEARWQELGGTLAGKDTFKNGDSSIASQITRMKGALSRADYVVLCSYIPGAASAIRQIRAAGIDKPMVASASMDGKFWLKSVPNLSDFYYVAYASLWGDDPEPKVNELVTRYKEETGQDPTQSTSMVGYRAIQLIAKGIEDAKAIDGIAIANALNRLKAFPTVLGPLTYTPDLHFQVSNPVRVVKIEDGVQSLVKVWTPEKVPPVTF